MTVDVRRADQRFVTRGQALESRHSFSFGRHYDPGNTSYGLLLLHDEHLLQPGAGFPSHPHRDLEIVSWVLEGALVHENSSGGSGRLGPGSVQVTSAGSGIRHAETAARDGGTRFVQMWLPPDVAGRRPSHEQRRMDLPPGLLVPVASGRPGHAKAVRIGTGQAALHAARLEPGQAVALPAAPYLHLYVARGSVRLAAAGGLAQGDTARMTTTDGPRVVASTAAELLVWEMHAAIGA
ncbi:MAG: pirin family protein [Mycobacteriales bacterium]